MACWAWRDAVVSSSAEGFEPPFNRRRAYKRAALPWSARFCFKHRKWLIGAWPSRLVATAAEDRLNIRRNPHTSFAAASDCRKIAIYEYTPNSLLALNCRAGKTISFHQLFQYPLGFLLIGIFNPLTKSDPTPAQSKWDRGSPSQPSSDPPASARAVGALLPQQHNGANSNMKNARIGNAARRMDCASVETVATQTIRSAVIRVASDRTYLSNSAFPMLGNRPSAPKIPQRSH